MGEADMAKTDIGTVVVSVMPVLDEDALNELVETMTERVKVAINKAIRDAVQITLPERVAQ